MTVRRKYDWKSLQVKLAQGAVYQPGDPFRYKHQLRIKSTPEALVYTYWIDDTCRQAGHFLGTRDKTWERLFGELEEKRILGIPCVGVGISVWHDRNILMRLESKKELTLSSINYGLRHAPESIRRDLLSTGVYGYSALALDDQKTMIYGIPLGFEVKAYAQIFPAAWGVVAWPGMVAFPFFQMKPCQPQDAVCHTVLTRKNSVNLLIQNQTLKYLQQDRLLVDTQELTAASVSKFQLLFSLYNNIPIHHFLYPVDVNTTWTNNLRAFLEEFKWTATIEIIAPAKFNFPQVPAEILLQDMFPLHLPWTT